MDLSSDVQWWDEWQLRILVLGSLGIQWFLLFAAPLRKYAIPYLFRKCIWMAYLGSDALAIYALATLFNRHTRATSNCDNRSMASVLEVLWAPVLLIHLGGQEEMTAYSIEDNELWRRHYITLVSQVTVALYAFWKSWPSSGERRLLAAAILLFILGILSFSEKPWALKRATIDNLAALSSLKERRKGSCVSRFLTFCTTELRKKKTAKILSDRDKLHMILADMSLSAAVADLKRVKRHEEVLQPLSPIAHKGLRRWLRTAFMLLYTRANVVLTPAYLAYHLFLVPSLHIAVITLFATSRKQGQNDTDVKITYIILCCTAALDVLSLFIIRKLLHALMYKADVPALCEMVAQHNLIASVLRRMQPTGWLMKCAAHLGCKYMYGKESRVAHDIVGFVVVNLLRVDKVQNLDLASYRRFSDPEIHKCNWAVSKELQEACGDEIRTSLQESLDRCVLLWHIATDLCFRFCIHSVGRHRDSRQVCIEAISNYMAYLLDFRPEMLMTGSRKYLFTEAMDELEIILKGQKGLAEGLINKESKAEDEELINKARKAVDDILKVTEARTEPVHDMEEKPKERSEPEHDIKIEKPTPTPTYCLIQDACSLAKELMDLPDEKRWEVMEGVWVSMLCYSASMCRGYLHAKSLGEGGEFLSFVWLLLSFKGVQTLADKLQKPEPDKQGAPDGMADFSPGIHEIQELFEELA